LATRQRDGVLRRILVSFGGGDPVGILPTVLAGVVDANLPNVSVDVVLGPSYVGEPPEIAREPVFRVYREVADMARLMSRADLAIGGGGSTSWERCALGLPVAVITLAANQMEATTCLREHGAIRYLGHFDKVGSRDVAMALTSLAESPDALVAMSHAARAVVGSGISGTQSVVDRISEVC